MSTAIVKQLNDYPGYYADETGRILSAWTRSNQKRSSVIGSDLRALVGSRGTNGYRTVALKHPSGSRRTEYVHVLVCSAFHGPRPNPSVQVRHLDGTKSNCEANNLKWGTRLENAADSIRHKTHRVGSSKKIAKLHESLIPEIRARIAGGEPLGVLAREFGVTSSTLSVLKSGKTWRHVA